MRIAIGFIPIVFMLALFPPANAGCAGKQSASGVVYASPPASLLLATPYFGNEKEPRNPAPKPIRMTIESESVAGWLTPAENRLRFPVELKEGTHLSFRLGASSKIPVKIGDLSAKVFYKRIDGSWLVRKKSTGIYQTEFTLDSNWQSSWLNADVDLSKLAPGKGELSFEIGGPLSASKEIQVLWGQPSIFIPQKQSHKNVLLIGIDTLRRDALSLYGGRSDVTPNLEHLSLNGVVFNRNWSQAPWTVPSFACTNTGRFPADLSSTLTTDQLPDSAVTLAEMLLPHGFATSMVCGNSYLGNDVSGYQQGMEGLWFEPNAKPEKTVRAAIKDISRNADRDWFLFLHFMDPHGPYDPPKEYIDRLCDPKYSGKYMTSFNDGPQWQIVREQPLDVEIKRARSLYDGEVADLDRAIGELFASLIADGLLDQTLILFTADHGEEFFEHGQFEHGQSLYEEMVHLPLIMWAPGIQGGTRIDASTGNIDATPTILDYLDLLPEQKEFPGFSLFDVIAGKAPEKRIIFGEGNLRRSSHRKFAVEWPYKCIYDYFTSQKWLYDLAADPLESKDISKQLPDIADRLAKQTNVAMPPLQTTFVLVMLGDPKGGPMRFSGTIKVPGGIGFVTGSGFIDGKDKYEKSGETVSFDFSTEATLEEPIKALVVIPGPKGDTIEASLLADGIVTPNRFYPYGTAEPSLSGTAMLNVYKMPWPALLPLNARESPVACYIIGIPGFPRGESGAFEHKELDPQTKEQLRALGYID